MILLNEIFFSFLGLLFHLEKGRFISETFRYPSQPTDTPRTPEMTVTLAGPSDLSRFSFDSPRLSPRELLGETCCDLLMWEFRINLDSSSLSLSDFFSFLLFFRDLDLQEKVKDQAVCWYMFNLLLLRLRFSFFTFFSLSSLSRSRSLGHQVRRKLRSK